MSDAAALRTALSRVTYRGGTSLAGLGALPLPAASQCVLVFDGEVTVDRGATFAPDCRLVALTATSGADGARLGGMTQHTGGAVVRLTAGGEAEALAALLVRQRPLCRFAMQPGGGWTRARCRHAPANGC